MKFLFSIVFVFAFIKMDVDAAAAKSAVHAQGLQPLCELSRDLKGIEKYVEMAVDGLKSELVALERVQQGILIRRNRGTSDCLILSLLQNYVRAKSQRVQSDINEAMTAGLKAGVANAYAAARIDEFVFDLAGATKQKSLNSNEVGCLVTGGAGTAAGTGIGITQDGGKDNEHVKYCFLPPGHKDITNDQGEIRYVKQAKTGGTGDYFLVTNAIGSSGCHLTDAASGQLFVGTQGPATWAVAGGAIVFNGAGANHASSKILSAEELFGATTGKNGVEIFTEARSRLSGFQSQVGNARKLMREAFQTRTLEELDGDNEFRKALSEQGILANSDQKMEAGIKALYDRMLKQYAESVKVAEEDREGRQYMSATRALNQKECAMEDNKGVTANASETKESKGLATADETPIKRSTAHQHSDAGTTKSRLITWIILSVFLK